MRKSLFVMSRLSWDILLFVVACVYAIKVYVLLSFQYNVLNHFSHGWLAEALKNPHEMHTIVEYSLLFIEHTVTLKLQGSRLMLVSLFSILPAWVFVPYILSAEQLEFACDG